MTASWRTIQRALVTTVAVVFFALFVFLGLTDGGPLGALEGAVVGALVAGMLLFRTFDNHLTTQQEGVALALFVLVAFGVVAGDSYAAGESLDLVMVLKFGAGLAVAAGFVCWPYLSDREHAD